MHAFAPVVLLAACFFSRRTHMPARLPLSSSAVHRTAWRDEDQPNTARSQRASEPVADACSPLSHNWGAVGKPCTCARMEISQGDHPPPSGQLVIVTGPGTATPHHGALTDDGLHVCMYVPAGMADPGSCAVWSASTHELHACPDEAGRHRHIGERGQLWATIGRRGLEPALSHRARPSAP